MELSMEDERNDSPLLRELRGLTGLNVKPNEPLARYTSIKIGGPADFLLDVETRATLVLALGLLNRYQVPFCLLGRGSNVLVSDLGYRGAVIRLGGKFRATQWAEGPKEAKVRVGAAFLMTQLAREAVEKGFSGLEFAEGIPGSVGGALVMNAGAYGSEMEKVIDGVEGVNTEGNPIRLTRREMAFSYRRVELPEGMVTTHVVFRLARGNPESMRLRLKELVTKRKTSQPSGHPNSGSMFRNPRGDFAGRLIEAAGLKGKTSGNAQISAKHANFIVNLGAAKAQDVKELMDLARDEVKKKFGVPLEPEIRLLGEWPVATEKS